jgi:23S rRNA pseudouridine1911/1915/1917 synthase
MSPVRGRQGREEQRAKKNAAGVVPKLNARRRASKERAAAERAAEAAAFESVPAAKPSGDPQAADPDAAQKSAIKKRSVKQPAPAGMGSEFTPRIHPDDEIDEEHSEVEDGGADGFLISADDADQRLDQYLAARLEGVSRARVQMLIEQGKVAVTHRDGAPVKVRASHKLSAGERVRVTGEAKLAPLRAMAEDIPLEIVYEDADLAVVNKPAGMMVHAGAGRVAEDERGKGTMVNALLHHLNHLSQPEDALRPGVVHRLDKMTSGLLVVAKNDAAHQKLSEAFAERETSKQYIALVQGRMKQDSGIVNTPISRDVNRRQRMTTRRSEGRAALTRWKVKQRLSTPWGEFTLLEVKIETGRTHQIRVHLSSVGHPVVGDTLYGAATEIKQAPAARQKATMASLRLERNFLHAARLGLRHPRSGEWIEWEVRLPEELESLLRKLQAK